MCECAVKLLSAAGWHVHAVSVGHDARWACPASIAASSRAACCWFRLPARKTTAREFRRCWALLLNFKSEKRASLARRGSASAPPWLNADVAKLPQGVRSGAWLIGSGWVLRSSRVSAASRKSCTAKRSVCVCFRSPPLSSSNVDSGADPAASLRRWPRRARGASQHRLCSRFQDPRLPLGARRRRLAVGRRQHSSADGVQEGKGAAASSASALLRRRGCAAQLLAALLRCFRPMRGRG
eukprot:COSAG06_NODE_3101_length_5859_cov_7.820517_2_plen_239_part_00